MKIYTKTGDRGTTSTFAGKRIQKTSLRIIAYGNVDELNSLIGLINTKINNETDIKKKLLRIQNELFVLQTDLAAQPGIKVKIPRITRSFVSRLEREIDNWDKSLPELRNFILPGGGELGSLVHLARTIARRSERSIVAFGAKEKVSVNALSYINRLSDWFFVLARYINKEEKHPETKWLGRSKRR